MAITGALKVEQASLLVKEEASYGTDPSPTAANGILAYDVEWEPEVEIHELPALNSYGSKEPHIIGAYYGTCSFSTPLVGSGTAGTDGHIDPVLKAGSLLDTTVASTSITYTTNLANFVSSTIYHYEDGVLYEMNGGAAKLSLEFEAGKYAVLKAEYSGLYVAVADAALVTPTFDTPEPPRWVSASLTWASQSLFVSKLSVDLGQAIAKLKSANVASGFHRFDVTSFDVKGSFTTEHDLVANYDFYGIMLAGTSCALTFQYGSAGNQHQINLDVCRIEKLTRGNEEGIRTLDVGFACFDNAGNDAFEYKQT